jgi:hypothetical protein
MRKISIIALCSIIIFSCGKTGDPESPAVARVSKTVLSQAELDRTLLSFSDRPYNKTEIVSDWIDRELLFLAAIEAGIENDETLKHQVEAYRKDLIGRTFMDNYIASGISVDNSEIREYYDENRDAFKHQNDGAKIIHFLVQSDTVAENIAETLRKTNQDIDRKELLAKYTVDVLDVAKGSLLVPVNDAIFSNSRRNIIGPIQTNFGYHVVEVLDRYRSGSQIELDNAFDEIYQTIYNQKKQVRATSLMDSLRNHYNVKLYLENN